METLAKTFAFLLTLGMLLSTDSLIQDYAIKQAEAAGYGSLVVSLVGTVLVLLAIICLLLWAGLTGRER